MKTSLAFRFATLGLVAALAAPAAATQAADADAAKAHHGHIMLSLGDGTGSELFDFEELAIGQSRQIQGKDGKIVTLTRAADGMTIQTGEKTIRVPMPAPGERMSRVRIERKDGGSPSSREVIALHHHDGTGAAEGDLELLLDGDGEGVMSIVRTALTTIDLGDVGEALDAIDLDGLDADVAEALAQARASGHGKVLVIRNKRTEGETKP